MAVILLLNLFTSLSILNSTETLYIPNQFFLRVTDPVEHLPYLAFLPRNCLKHTPEPWIASVQPSFSRCWSSSSSSLEPGPATMRLLLAVERKLQLLHIVRWSVGYLPLSHSHWSRLWCSFTHKHSDLRSCAHLSFVPLCTLQLLLLLLHAQSFLKTDVHSSQPSVQAHYPTMCLWSQWDHSSITAHGLLCASHAVWINVF